MFYLHLLYSVVHCLIVLLRCAAPDFVFTALMLEVGSACHSLILDAVSACHPLIIQLLQLPDILLMCVENSD